MSMTSLFTGRPPSEGEHVTDVYHYATRKGAIEAIDVAAADLGIDTHLVSEAVRHLVENRLLRTDDGIGGRFVPVDPDLAVASMVSSVEREIYRRRELIDQIRERAGAFATPAGGGDPAPSTVEYLVGAMEVRGFLKTAGDACRDELLVLQAGVSEAGDLSQMFLVLVARGVTVRVICQHRSRADVTTRLVMKRLTDAGVEVYTVSHVPRSAIVFDRSLVALFGGDGADGDVTLARVRNQGIARFFLDMFNHLWESATPLEGVEFGYGTVADDLQQSIAALMAKGYTDEVVARKLGMSVRSCRRHIATLMRDLDATSRFQAGVEAARKFLKTG
jgi:DNA-binding CsgD family transcriptional regulator